MTLLEYYDNLSSPKTDKGTSHDYIANYYDYLFANFKDSEIDLLEIGVQEGYSFDLWRGWFTNARLYAFDIGTWRSTTDRINQHNNSKGYNLNAFTTEALEAVGNTLFDFIIEDGPHTLSTQIFAAEHWSQKLKVNGKLIIEDVQTPETDVEVIVSVIKDNSDFFYKTIDLRSNKNRYDDFIIEITRVK